MNISNLLPKDEYANQRRKAVQLGKKWEKTGLLEGLTGSEKGNMAQLLENQARQVLVEASRTGNQEGSEEWAGIALPLVRRIFSEISSKDYVSVQPMNLPSGLVFFLDFKYGTGQPGFNSNSGKDSQNDSIFGVTDQDKGTAQNPYGFNTPAEGLYGPGRFGYTINDTSSSALEPGAAADETTFVTGSVAAADYNFNSEFSASIVAPGSSLTRIVVSVDSLEEYDSNGARAFTIINSTGDFIHDFYPEFTKVNRQAGTVTFVASASALDPTDRIKVNYHRQPAPTSRGDFEDGRAPQLRADGNLDIPEINLEFRSEEIVAKTRKLKAKWTPEFSQDLNAYQNIDAEAELTSILSEYISQEIDLELLDMLMSNAQSTDYWSSRIGYEYNGSNAFVASTENRTAYTQQTWFQTLGTKIQKVSNRIHTLTMRGGANFLVVSPTVATILESIPGYAADTDGNKSRFAMGVQKIGQINNRFQVYKNPYMVENAILMGYRGAQYLETGAVYAPYIPLMMTPVVLDPENFTPRKGVMTRYAKKMLRPEFYGKILIEGLNTL